MATSNRVFVSPGVYTSEKDLTFVAQSVGVTTLGLVGETLKGPAFEPLLITGFDEFKTYFGGTLPDKDGDGNPKYELPYVAKSYLQESNQLFVTRILGLTGYKPVKTYGIQTLGGITVDRDITNSNPLIEIFHFNPVTPLSTTGSTQMYRELSGKTAFDGLSITDHIIANYSGYCTGVQGCPDDGNWFTIGLVPDITLNVTTEGGVLITDISSTFNTEQLSPLTGTDMANSPNQKEWYNVFFHQAIPGNDSSIDGVYSYLFAWNSYWGWFDVVRFKWDAQLNNDYADIVVAALRSRGHYVSNTLNLETTLNSHFTLAKIDDIETNPLGEFRIYVTGATEGAKSFICSLDMTSSKYISKVLGNGVFDKPRAQYPLYVHEVYSNLLLSLYQRGLVRGLSLNEVYNDEGTKFVKEWDTPISPMVVSEVRGGKVADLFEVITIPDGESANFQVKIMIQNINLDSGEFDLIVRDFNDTDENLVVLEKYSRCSMNPDFPGYIAKKIGTSNGDYELKSKYIMINMAENAPTDAFPAGFKGFVSNQNFSGATLGSVLFKTQYYDAGDVVYYEPNGDSVLSSGDRVRKVSLGLSSQIASQYDSDLFKYKSTEAVGQTFGFHLSKNASTITGTTYQCTPYDLEGTSKGKLDSISYRKFTFTVGGGFDGWDIYRDVRTYEDAYIFGKTTYVANNTTNGGVFSTTVGNSDYYSYLKGILTYANPEAVDINIFATPGINFFDHSSLTAQAIDMVENDRADSLYIINSPNESDVDAIVGDLDDVAIDSNYSATYWPWIQIRDTDNATQLYIPPTGEVCKNIAMTDNISYPWFAVAGYQRGLVNSIKAVKKLTLDDRDNLYKNRINPIATFSDTGTIIWGNKTLQVRESALDRINVRRLLLRARKLISAVSVRLLFEQNDDQVRQEFLRLVNPILESIKKERGLYDFRVKVSNDPEDIDANTLRGKIYIKPTRSLEFIEVEFNITPTGASFENI
jgi:hypothetical protein